MKTPHQIFTEVNGRAFDIDGYYGAQCWDGIMYINRTYWGGSVHSCGGDGFVYNLWTNRKTNGILNDFVEIPIAQAQDGDVFIWDKGAPECGYSHIAMFRKWDGSGRAIFLGQNQGGINGAFNQRSISISGVLGVLRPKCYVSKSSGSKPDQILEVGSVVTSTPMAITEIKTVAGSGCAYVPDLGGYFPLAYLSEADAGDGRKDNILNGTRSKVTLDKTKVEAIQQPSKEWPNGMVKIHGIWVDATPLVEL